MKLYNCKVLLHGEILNQVPKELVTAAEIAVLRGLHVGNNDAVVDIVLVGETNRSDAAERRRLANHYGNDPFSLDGETSVSGTELVNRYFPPGVPLPQELPENLFDDQKRVSHDEDEVITLFDPATGKMETLRADTPAGAAAARVMGNDDVEDPFAMTREAVRAQPKPEKVDTTPTGLRGISRRVATEA